MDIKALSKPLSVSDIEFRVQSIVGQNERYAIILAYKDARVDMNRLDEVVGALNWQRKHQLVGDHLHCEVSIFNTETGQWVSKSDVGTQSNTEATKGEASDSFKRACFNWGIGRELYGFPFIMVKLNNDEFRLNGNKAQATNKLKPGNWQWELQSADDGTVLSLKAFDKGNQRFYYSANTQSKPKQAQQPRTSAGQAPKQPQQQQRQQKPNYSDKQLNANAAQWKVDLSDGKYNVGALLGTLSGQFTLTQQQVNTIRGLAPQQYQQQVNKNER